jgi:hypothetical protein
MRYSPFQSRFHRAVHGAFHHAARSRRAARLAGAAAAFAVLAGCGTAPLSFLNDRQVYYKAVLHRYPVFVEAVDGVSTAFRPVPIGPGEHRVRFGAPAVAGFSQPVEKTFTMTIQPCTRYYVAAQRPSAFSQDWDLVVEQTWPVAGCDPEKEWQKAKIASAAAPVAPSSSIESTPVASAAGARSAPR